MGLCPSAEMRAPKIEQAIMTLQGMADQRFTSDSFFTNVFLGEIFFPLIFSELDR